MLAGRDPAPVDGGDGEGKGSRRPHAGVPDRIPADDRVTPDGSVLLAAKVTGLKPPTAVTAKDPGAPSAKTAASPLVTVGGTSKHSSVVVSDPVLSSASPA